MINYYKTRVLELEEEVKRLRANSVKPGLEYYKIIADKLEATGWRHYCAPQNDFIVTYGPTCSWCMASSDTTIPSTTIPSTTIPSTTIPSTTIAPLAREGEQLGGVESGGGPWNGMSEAVLNGLITEKEKLSLTLVDRIDEHLKEDHSNYGFLTDPIFDFGYYEEDEDDYDINQDRDEDDG